MHATFFGLKRAHQSTLRIVRPMLAQMGLTAARFDLLYALKDRRKYGMRQGNLQRVLGVTRATVSRMVRSLEELGFVRREIDECDRRRKRVWLTDEGFARMDSAHEHLVRSGWVQLAIDSTLGSRGNPGGFCYGPCLKQMWELDWHLEALRRGFYDTGSLEYPYSERKDR